MNRREFLLKTGGAAVAGLGISAFPTAWAADTAAPRRKILMFTKSSGYEHSAIKRKDGKLGFAEQLLTDLGAQHGFEVTCTKDGSVFTPENIAGYDAFFFY